MPEVVCPFCNSRIESLADAARPICPRCDATLPADLVAIFVARRSEQIRSGLPAAIPAGVPMPVVFGRRKTIFTILGVMAFMAVVATGFALWTQPFRRGNDLKPQFVYSEPASSSPLEMTSVGLLPARCQLVGAINFTDLRANPVAKKAVLDAMPAGLDWLAKTLTSSTGLQLDDVAQAAFGLELGEGDGAMKIYAVVQTNKPYDAAAVVKASGARSPKTLRKRPFVPISLPYGAGVVWCASDNHLAFLVAPLEVPSGDLEAFPDRPRQKLEGSSETLRSLVDERVDKQSLAWLAGQTGSLGTIVSGLGGRTSPYRPLLDAKAFAISIKTDRDAVVLARILPKSAKEVPAVEEWFNVVDWRGAASKKVVTTPPEAKAEPWVEMQLRYSPEAIRELLSKGPGVKKE